MPFGPDGTWFEAAAPIRVAGGIRARTRRGSIGSTWWSRRFIDILEAVCDSGRLARGRAYARKGQVLRLEITPGEATAEVQGSRPEPYRVSVAITAYGEPEWTRLQAALAERAGHRARLLAGEMPPEIEEVFAACGLPLFPTRVAAAGARRTHDDLEMSCSCPDWGFPCKHLSAVLYLLAEAFDDDPFLVLAWRGRTKDDLLAALRVTEAAAHDPLAIEDPPFTDRLADFYTPGTGLSRLTGDGRPAHPDLLLRLAEPPRITIRDTPLADLLEAVYRRLGAPGPGPGDPDAG